MPRADDIEARLVSVERRKGFNDFHAFVKMAWHVVEPRPFEDNWHIEEECAHLEALTRGKPLPSGLPFRFLAINQPPGTSKSIIATVIWPVWDQLQHPTNRIANVSYDKSLALRDSGKSLKLIQSDWFKARWGDRLTIKGANPAEGEYEFIQGGCRYATSVGGAITGRHFDRIIVDDPTKPKDVTGQILQNTRDWWEGTLPSRVAPGTGSIVLVMQRLHVADLTGVALSEADREWVHLRFPMRFEAKESCRTPFGGDRRTVEGELLWPSRFPESEVQQLARRGSRHFASQYQQRPVPEGGNVFKAEWFRSWILAGVTLPPVLGEEEPKIRPDTFDLIAISVDCAFKDLESSDYVCIQVWGKKRGDFFLLDQVHDQLSFSATLQAIRKMLTKWKRVRAVLIEDKANGPAIISEMRKKGVSGVIEVNPQGGKMARAQAASPTFEAGNVFFPHPGLYEWVDPLRDELSTFPVAPNDDRVDACTQFLVWILARGAGWASAMEEHRKRGGGSLFS